MKVRMQRMKLTWFDDRQNCLYIHSDAITKKLGSHSAEIEYMQKPYTERIAESPYREAIEKEIAKHPGCKIGEYIPGPVF